MPKIKFYIAGILYSLIGHIAIFALVFWGVDFSVVMRDESGTDATLGEKNTSIMILSTLPTGQLKEVALNAKKSTTSSKNSAKKSSISDISTKDTKEGVLHTQRLEEEIKNDDMSESSQDFGEVSSPSQSADFTNSTQKQQYASAPKEGKDNTTNTTALGASSSDKVSYQGLLSAHLSRFKQYPSSALARQEEGIIIVSIQINEKGFGLERYVKKKCAYNTLNTEVIALIDRANPLPPPPKEMLQGGKLTFSMPILYSIKDYYKK